jgi:Do/DeqQ family serine protease
VWLQARSIVPFGRKLDGRYTEISVLFFENFASIIINNHKEVWAMIRLFCGILFLSLSASATVPPQSKEQINVSFSPIVKTAGPAVVNIFTQRVIHSRSDWVTNDPLFQQLFGFGAPRGLAKDKIARSLGSGVIVSDDGLIITSNHVIQNSDQVKVVLEDRREFEAQIVKTDEKTDLAVLKVNPGSEKLPFLKMGASKDLEVGDLILAIGNPFGLGQTVTSGIISALARTFQGISDYRYFIQTDAAINQGNSGGALVDINGHLIGINTAIFSKSGGSVGVGFAIPVDMVKVVLRSVGSKSGLIRAWLGFKGQNVTTVVAEAIGLKRPKGIIINSVYSKGPADKAKLLPGDVIYQVGGRDVNEYAGLEFIVATQEIGKTVPFSVIRKGKALSVSFPLEAPKELIPRKVTQLIGPHPLENATIGNLSPALADEMSLDHFETGVVITKVKRGSPADRLGLVVGDIIQKINGVSVKNVGALVSLLKREKRKWVIVFKRGSDILQIAVRA